MSQRYLLMVAAFLGALSVALGAFGAHGLKSRLAPEQLQVFETGVRYMFYHVLAMFLLAVFPNQSEMHYITYAALFFMAGILFFSGSLFLLSCRDILGIVSWKWLGPVTPVGGLFFVLGWISIMMHAIRMKI
jgi:uncharacterized membrane protein YgdD (TMEM256/DUF423 family)